VQTSLLKLLFLAGQSPFGIEIGALAGATARIVLYSVVDRRTPPQ
jgi:hypothetical protein